MSNFEVGDRVVVVSEDTVYRFERGTVSSINTSLDFPFRVDRDGGSATSFMASELELEGVYDALSAKPAEEVFSSDPEVDSRLVEEFVKSFEGDGVNHPSHYADGWSNGAEVIDITEHLNFNRGNAVKYLSRAGKKGGSEKELEDLQKALWYITREVQRLGGNA
jgi:hypothetical protein